MNDGLNRYSFDVAPAKAAASRIGIFDSGVGGLSILRALRFRLPDASMVYVGDVACAPYGDRSPQEVLVRCVRVVGWLVAQGATMIVVACNTATVLAIESLRSRWPDLVFVGVEPGVKPAVAVSRTRRIAVMTTAATAGSDRLKHLIASHASHAHIHVQTCPGLVDAIERGDWRGPRLLEVLTPYVDAIRAANVDTVVLGCTHYPLIDTVIQTLVGNNVTVIDTAHAIGERCASLWRSGSPGVDAPPTLCVLSTGATRTMQALLGMCAGFERDRVQVLTIIDAASPG